MLIYPDYDGIALKTEFKDGIKKVFDNIRRKWVTLSPEEHVRQYLLGYLSARLNYPASLIAVEKTIIVSGQKKRFDIVVYNREHRPWMLIECKEPGVPLSEKMLFQLLNYQQQMQCSFWVLANGPEAMCADARDAASIKWLNSFPAYDL